MLPICWRRRILILIRLLLGAILLLWLRLLLVGLGLLRACPLQREVDFLLREVLGAQKSSALFYWSGCHGRVLED